MRWVVEESVFADRYQAFKTAAAAAGHQVTVWDDAWWSDGAPSFLGERVLFHGSLGNADRVKRDLSWAPGAYCATEAFHCSRWYEGAKEFLVQRDWQLTTVRRLVETGAPFDTIFVRPDSPLKPFSGRILAAKDVSLAALDHGFYYDDDELPVIVASLRDVGAEYRFVVVEGRIVAGSAYQADGRHALVSDLPAKVRAYAAAVAAAIAPPEPVYVLDVCEVDGGLGLLELNPFSGADLYACDPDAIVANVADTVERSDAAPT